MVSLNYRKAYPIIKSLKRKGAYIVAATSASKDTGILFSRFINKAYKIHDSSRNQDKYIRDLLSIIKSESIDLVIPVGFSDFYVLSKFYDIIAKYAIIPVPPFDMLKSVADKYELRSLATRININYPKTLLYPETALKTITEELDFPVVVKYRSDNSSPAIIISIKDLVREINKRNSCLVQEYITGYGTGFLLLPIKAILWLTLCIRE